MARKAKPVKRGRRARGTGTVVLRKDGRWQYSYCHNGKRFTGYADSWEEADRLVLEAIEKVRKQGFVSARMTTGDYLTEWFRSRTHDIKPNTRKNWESVLLSRIIPAIGGIPIGDLQRYHLQDLVNAWAAEGLKPSTIRTHFTPLRTAIIAAIQDEIIGHNPCAFIRFPKVKKLEPEQEQLDEDENKETQLDEGKKILTIEQGNQLLAQLDRHWLYPVVLTALATGLRRGELIALKWRDVDLQAGKLHVRRNAALIPGAPDGYVEDTPKSQSSRRVVPLPDFACAMLKDHRLKQNAIRLECENWQPMDLVFCRKDGTHIRESSIGYALDVALKRAGLPDITMHGLRHSAASILIALGISDVVVSQILGHSNPAITKRIYTHMMPSDDSKAMRQYHQAFTASEIKKEAN